MDKRTTLIEGKIKEQLENVLSKEVFQKIDSLDFEDKKLIDILDIIVNEDRNKVLQVAANEFGCSIADMSAPVPAEILKYVPKGIAKQYKIMPLFICDNKLNLASTDPKNIFLIDDLRTVTKMDIQLLLAFEKDILNAIAEKYEGVSHESIERIVEGIDGDEVSLLEDQEEKTSHAELLRLTQEAPVVKLTNMILASGVKLRASDILIEPLEDSLRIRYRIDGMLVEGKNPPKRVQSAIVSRIKIMSDLNIAERRLPQDGRFKIKIQGREVDFRVSVLPTNVGEKVALRVLDKSQATLDIDKLGFDGKALIDLKTASERPHGLILVCGPTGCGKTTTLYSLLKHIDVPSQNLITVEDPVEYQLFGVNQVSVKPDIGLTFSSALRSILRQDPDIIMIGEIRDFETVDIAIKAALTGHLVLSTLHTTTASGSIVRLINMGVEPFLITSSVLLVSAQRLIRQLCSKCKEPANVLPEILSKFGIDKSHKIYAAKGCPHCDKTGYQGRTGITEVLFLTPKIKDLIFSRAQEHEIVKAAREEGMRTLREHAILKLLAGETSVDEVLRLTV